MRRIALLAIAFGFLVPFLAPAPAHAQATRTWVSGVGDDANPCSRTAPCKTFAGAISKTATAGEINCLDPGGFGAVTITKSITLNCHEVFGSILAAGTSGVTINAIAAGSKVILRGLQIQGVLGTPTPGTIGVRILAAQQVSIEDSVITQFGQQGIQDSRTGSGNRLVIKDTTISHNASTGIGLGGAAVTGTTIDNVRSFDNLFGIGAVNGNNVSIRRSVFSNNSNAGIEADPGAQINVNDTTISGNGTGVQASGTIRLSNSDISFNSTAITGSGAQTYGNNRISGNGAVGSAPTAASPGQQ
jgi:hypothetical protein